MEARNNTTGTFLFRSHVPRFWVGLHTYIFRHQYYNQEVFRTGCDMNKCWLTDKMVLVSYTIDVCRLPWATSLTLSGRSPRWSEALSEPPFSSVEGHLDFLLSREYLLQPFIITQIIHQVTSKQHNWYVLCIYLHSSIKSHYKPLIDTVSLLSATVKVWNANVLERMTHMVQFAGGCEKPSLSLH